MNKRLADLDERTRRAVANALAKEEKKDHKNNESFIRTVDDAKALIKAIESDETTVTLSSGTFDISPSYVAGAKSWWIQKQRSYTPCGHFTPMKLKTMIAVWENEE